jgi:hypothetical protein
VSGCLNPQDFFSITIKGFKISTGIASKIKIISYFCVIKQENTDKKITQRHPWRT